MAEKLGQEVEQLPVRISYDIIRLYSEGLYKSPHKAVEELVSNSYDADARNVRIVLSKRKQGDETPAGSGDSLWVVDDGSGMDVAGFRDLWRVADSKKSRFMSGMAKRPQIGQFGIGKLAAYVLAWKLTHISRVGSRFLLTEIDFRRIAELKRDSNPVPVNVPLMEVSKSTAMNLLSAIEFRDPIAWKSLFGNDARTSSWTATGLSDFKDIYERLKLGRLKWALSTGFPLQREFKVWIDGTLVQTSETKSPRIREIQLGSGEDTVAMSLGFTVHKSPPAWVELPGIGRVNGRVEVFQDSLAGTRPESQGRRHGFFVRVRGRVINLEDEFFGLPSQDHPAWFRFVLEMDADALHHHLLTCREGVKYFNGLDQLREYLHGLFNLARSVYESWDRRGNIGLMQLPSDAPCALITEPLIDTLRLIVKTGKDSLYMKVPFRARGDDYECSMGLNGERVRKNPFQDTRFEREGVHAPALQYFPESQVLRANPDHPFVDKLIESDECNDSARLFCCSELLLEGQLHGMGLSAGSISKLLSDRDRMLRLLAGNVPLKAVEVLRLLREANDDPIALERLVGVVFQALGFEYQRIGNHASSLGCISDAKFGKLEMTTTDDKLVYGARHTDQHSIPANKIDFVALESFRSEESADYGFFIAHTYEGESDPSSNLNNDFHSPGNERITLLKVEHLNQIVRLHYRYGITLAELSKIFAQARTVMDVDNALNSLKKRFEEHNLPLRTLLEGLEEEKSDHLAVPNYHVVRSKNTALRAFEPERLGALLKGVESIVEKGWLEVDDYNGQVIMHQSPDKIIETFEAAMVELGLLN